MSLAAPGLNDQVVGDVQSNGVGVAAQWNLGAVNPTPARHPLDGVVTSAARARLSLASSSAAVATGQTATVKVTARTNDGRPDPGRTVLYAVTGANPSAAR